VEFWGDVIRLLLAGTLQLISAPVAGHMLGRAAYWAGPRVTRHTIIDQLWSARDGTDGLVAGEQPVLPTARSEVEE